MAVTATGDLVAAHAAVVAVIQAIPDVTLDWQPGGEDWSLKRNSTGLSSSIRGDRMPSLRTRRYADG